MKTFVQLLLAAIVAAAATYYMPHQEAAAPGTAAKPTAYDHVKQTGEIRCSYAALYPYVIVDPNTKQLSGIFYDAMNEIGKRTGMKVAWTEEVGFGNINQGFETGRYDAFCSGLWPSGVRSPYSAFSDAIVYDIVSGWVRPDDHRFDNNQLDKLNDSANTVVAIEGDTTMSIAQNMFPHAKLMPISQSQPTTDSYLAVATGKADVVFGTVTNIMQYVKTNPGALRQVDAPPARVIPLTIGYPEGDLRLKNMIDPVIAEMQDDGFIRRTVARYLGDDQKVLYFAGKPYEAAE